MLHHCFFEFLRGSEGDLLAGLYVDRRAGRRIASLTGCALAHHEDAQPADADSVTLLEMLGDQADQIAEFAAVTLGVPRTVFVDAKAESSVA